GSLGRYAQKSGDGQDRAFYCAMRDGTAHDRQRMSSADAHIEYCAGSFFTAIQLNRLTEFNLPTSDGLLQRFLPLIMREATAYEDSADSDDAKTLMRPIRDALAALVPKMENDPYGRAKAVPYKLTPDGSALYQAFANDMRIAARGDEPSREY